MNSRIICGLTHQKKFIVNKKKQKYTNLGGSLEDIFFAKKFLYILAKLKNDSVIFIYLIQFVS